MVLAFRGQHHTETELAQAFNTVPLLGTLPENVVSGLEEMGYGLAGQEITFLDPARTSQTTMRGSHFIQVWSKLDHQGIVVWV